MTPEALRPFRSIFDLISCSPVTLNLMKMIFSCTFNSNGYPPPNPQKQKKTPDA